MRRGRIEEGYREKFRTLLARVHPRRLEHGVEILVGRAHELAVRENLPLPKALAEIYEGARRRVEKRVALMVACTVAPPAEAKKDSPRFCCDVNLGGLARWLRAAGYEASWTAGIEDSKLVEDARRSGAILVTGDVGILKRRAVRNGHVAAVWIPSSTPRLEQFAMLAKELRLTLKTPRCMSCGGELTHVPKEEVVGRIPPRTALWKDEYFLCSVCGKLFWRGTHWERIASCLAGAISS